MARLDPRIKATILRKFSENPDIPGDEAVRIVRQYAPMPDIKKLEDQHFKRLTNRIMGSFKDKQGIRDVFALKGAGVFINVPMSQNEDQLRAIKTQLQGKFEGLDAAIRKVRKRQSIVSGQIDLFDDEEDNKTAEDSG